MILLFISPAQLKGWDVLLRLQFENMIINHLEDILPCLGLERSMVLSTPLTLEGKCGLISHKSLG